MSRSDEATLFMLCGMTGSGKSTLARRLEAEHAALRLLPDEWIKRLDLDPRDPVRRSEIERIMLEIAGRALAGGCNVVLEAGFWSRGERDEGRAIAVAAGAEARLIWLDVPLDELKRRIERRNADLPPNTFPVAPGELDDWMAEFEPPARTSIPSRRRPDSALRLAKSRQRRDIGAWTMRSLALRRR